MHTAAIPLGGMSITNDIAYGLTINLEQAEELKCKHGIAKEALSSDEKNIIIKGTNARENIEISQKRLSGIIEARMQEIFHLAKSEIRKVENEVKLNFGVVLTGGGSRLYNIEDLAQEVFELKIKVGKPNSINGIDDIINNPRYATTIGLIKYVLNENDDKRTHQNKSEMPDLIDTIKNYLNKGLNYLKLK